MVLWSISKHSEKGNELDSVRIALITIGQTPREDVLSEIRPLILPHIDIMEAGLLDDLDEEKISRLKPKKEEMALVSRLKDGSQILLGEYKIRSMLSQSIRALISKREIDAAGILCTHDFPATKFPVPVIFPAAYLKFIIYQVMRIETLGVVVPLKSQMDWPKKKWSGKKVEWEAKSPYDQGKTWHKIAQTFNQKKTEAIILDCIGYSIKDKMELKKHFDRPVLVPRIVLAQAINCLF